MEQKNSFTKCQNSWEYLKTYEKPANLLTCRIPDLWWPSSLGEISCLLFLSWAIGFVRNWPHGRELLLVLDVFFPLCCTWGNHQLSLPIPIISLLLAAHLVVALRIHECKCHSLFTAVVCCLRPSISCL